jgi:hypothetical protein
MIIAMASVVSQVYVMDTSSAVAMDTDNPGMEPTNRPAIDPMNTRITNLGSITDNISVIFMSSYGSNT